MRNFDDLSEREMLALAIANEEEDGRIYADFADGAARGLSRPAPRCSPRWRPRRTSTAAG